MTLFIRNSFSELEAQSYLLVQLLTEYHLRIQQILAERTELSNMKLPLGEKISTPMIVIALDELHIAHSLFRDVFVSATVLDALEKDLHNLPIDQVWPLSHIPEGQFDGTLKGRIFDSVIDATVDLGLTNCQLSGSLDSKKVTSSSFTGQLRGHFEGALTGHVCGALKGNVAMGCWDLHVCGRHIIRYGPGSGRERPLSSILVAAIPQNITSVLSGTKTNLVQYTDQKTAAGKNNKPFIISEFPIVEEPLEFIDSYIDTTPLKPFSDHPLICEIRDMLRGRLRLSVAFIRLFYRECKVHKVFSHLFLILFYCYRPAKVSSPPHWSYGSECTTFAEKSTVYS